VRDREDLKNMAEKKFPVDKIELRVRYAETDQMGVVYYANYLVWFEVARTEYFRKLNILYSGLEKKGIYLVVAESNCKYKSSVKYDDMIHVITRLNYVKASSLEFGYEIFQRNKLIATGRTTHVFINRRRKPIRIPLEVIRVLKIKD